MARRRRPLNDEEKRQLTYEHALSPTQQWLNQFAENWIFAFVVAMAIRGLLLEAYRIPSASMEPIMYGDSAILHSDHVVVDRISHFFSLPQRWDVTVFQYPRPEVMAPGGAVINIDHPMAPEATFANRIHRNFVKRCVVMPGDTFFIRGGDLYLQGEDGHFAVPEKPRSVQEALWLDVYQHGEQPSYLPWDIEGSAQVADQNGALRIVPAGAEVRFAQPFSNLYLKPGVCRVAPLDDVRAAQRAGRQLGPDFGKQVEVSMTAPQFTYPLSNGQERTGNIWDLRTWQVSRLTTTDLDSDRYGTELNRIMDEPVGDVAIDFTVQSLSGSVQLELREGTVQAFVLQLSESGWSLMEAMQEQELIAGQESLVGRRVVLEHLDDRLRLFIDGSLQGQVFATKPVVPGEQPSTVRWTGSGEVLLAAIGMRRDVHYCRNGFLLDERLPEQQRHPDSGLSYRKLRSLVARGPDAMPARTDAEKQQMFRQWSSAVALHHYQLEQQRLVREQMTGEAIRAGSKQAMMAIACSEDTAVTAPDQAYLMLGDNSPHSLDGRAWGWVPATNIRGEVLAIAFPPWRMGLVR